MTGDAVYGSDSQCRRFLQGRRIAYVLGITSGYPVRPYTVGSLAQALPPPRLEAAQRGSGA